MRRILCGSAALLAALAVVAPANAQRRTSLGVAAGATVPTGTLGDATSVGFHILGTLSVSGTASSPLGFRVDGMYNSLSGKNDGPDVNIWTVNGNLVYAFPGGMTATPYVIAGAGWYNAKADGAEESSSDFGINGGVGLRFALSGFSTFAEARFHNVFSDPESSRIIPLTFGIMF
jgi:outer membrane protein with beta-barrel domain